MLLLLLLPCLGLKPVSLPPFCSLFLSQVKSYIRLNCPDNDPLVHVEYSNNEKESLNCAEMGVQSMLEHLSRRTREIDAGDMLSRVAAEPITHIRLGKRCVDMTPETIEMIKAGKLSIVTGEEVSTSKASKN